MTDRMSDGGRLSRGPGLLLKTGRGLPTYRNEANFGRATGKMIKVGDLARDEDGFEDFNKYLEEDVFVSPPPTFTARTKKPAKKSIILMPEDSTDEFEPRDDDTPKQYFIKPPSSRGPASSKKPAVVPSRSVQHHSQIDYDSIPSPDISRNYMSRKSVAKTTISQNASSKGKGKSTYLAEEDDEEQNMGDSNMDETMPLDEPEMQFNQEDDDSGQDDVGGDFGMDVDNEREPEPTPRARGRKVEVEVDDADRGGYDQNDYGNDAPMDDADSQQDEPGPSESPRAKRARQKKEAKENEKTKAAKEKERSKKENRAPLRTKDPNAQPKKRVRREFINHDDEDGVRRGKRYRYKPLEFWRGEHIVVGRPTRDEPPVPIIHEIIRVPQEEVIHLGVQPKSRRRGASKPASSRGGSRRAQDIYIENPEEGWDAETEREGLVMDFETKKEIKRDIARTAAALDLQLVGNANYSFEKVFNDAEYLAGGIIQIPVGSKKPNKPSNDNTYLFYCIEGAVRVKVHNSVFVISTGGMFMVPRGNYYLIENISDRDCKIFFAQARKVYHDMVPSPTKRGSVAPQSSGGRGSRTPVTSSPSKPRKQAR